MAEEAINLEWPKEQWAALRRQMNRAVEELGRSLPQAVRFGAWAVAGALGTATAVSDKQRPYKQVPTTRKKPQKKYEITSYKTGKAATFIRYANKVSDLKQSRKIAARGLAKAAWGWGIAATGTRSGAFSGATPWAKKVAGNMMAVDRSQAKDTTNPKITLENKLPYAIKALGGGERDVSDAIARASRRMEKVIDGRLKALAEAAT